MKQELFEKAIKQTTQLILENLHFFCGSSRVEKKGLINTRELISKDYARFKKAQKIILKSMLTIEKEIKNQAEIDKQKYEKLYYQKRVFEEIANTLLWQSFLEKEQTIKHLFAKNPGERSLINQNLKSIKRIANLLNQDRYQFALISDLTSIVDIGDIVLTYVPKDPPPTVKAEIIEVKSGKVNRIIEKIINERNKEKKKEAQDYLYLKYGKGGKKQMERVLRQKKRYLEYEKLIKKGGGKDLVYNKPVVTFETKQKDEFYFDLMNELLRNFYEQKKDIQLVKIDHLVFGFVKKPKEYQDEFVNRLDFKHHLYHDYITKNWLDCCYLDKPLDKEKFLQEFKTYKALPIYDLRETLKIPPIKPIFLSGLELNFIEDIIFNKLSVYIYHDSETLLARLKEKGINISLTKRGVGDKIDKEFLKIKERFLILHPKNSNIQLHLSKRFLLKTMFEFQSLNSSIEKLKEYLNSYHNE